MRMIQRLTVLLFVMVSLVFLGTKIHIYRTTDSAPPVISCESDVVNVRVGADDSVLLKGVTAVDNVDGDLTDQIMIKGISQLITADTAKITYIVFDSSNNMSTAQRTIHYTNYEKPKLSLSAPFVFQVGSDIRLLPHLEALDVIDGNISDSIRVTNQNVNPSSAGLYYVTLQVANSLGDVESVPVKVVILDHMPAALPVTLSEYITYVDAGSTFTPARYITSPANKSSVVIESQVDTTQPGTYEVSYTYQNYTAYQTVVVR